MRLLQNHLFYLFDDCFTRFGSNSLALTPSVVCFTPNSEVDNNYQSPVLSLAKIPMSTTINFIFVDVYL